MGGTPRVLCCVANPVLTKPAPAATPSITVGLARAPSTHTTYLPTVGQLLGSNMRTFGPDLLQSYSIHQCVCPPALFRAENGQIQPIKVMCWQHDQEHILVLGVPTVRLRRVHVLGGSQVR